VVNIVFCSRLQRDLPGRRIRPTDKNVPRKVKHLDFGVRIMIHYYKEGDSLKISHEQQQLSPQLQGDSYIAVGHLLTPPGLTAYVTVLWKPEACCECPAIGQSKDIQ